MVSAITEWANVSNLNQKLIEKSIFFFNSILKYKIIPM